MGHNNTACACGPVLWTFIEKNRTFMCVYKSHNLPSWRVSIIY